jgi:hypothetical protein
MEVSRQLHTPATLPPGKEHPVPIAQEAGWAPDPVWTLWRRENFPTPVGNRTPIVQPVSTRLGKDFNKILRAHLILVPFNPTYLFILLLFNNAVLTTRYRAWN